MPMAFLWTFLLLLAVSVPVVFGLLIASGVTVVNDLGNDFKPRDLNSLLSQLFSGMSSVPLMALPMFILAGEIMNTGGITARLVHFSQTLIGHVRGGLAHVNILSSILFAGLSGSAVADTSALGSMLIPAMEKNGYSRQFAAAVTAASSVIGPIIPPSGIMIIYAFIMGVSPAALFAAGLIPGLMIGGGLMAVTYFLAIKHDFPVANERAPAREVARAAGASFWPLLTPVILLGGILSGWFTPTEAAGVAAFYAFFVALVVLRTLKLREVPRVFLRAAVASGIILLLIGASKSFSWVADQVGAAQMLSDFLLSLTENPLLLLFLCNIMLFIVGMFLDAGPAILILGPILGSVFVTDLGLDPVHFAIIMCVNVTVGLATPPMGLVLFVASSVAKVRVELIVKSMLPFLAVEVLVILLITYVEDLTLFLPRALGLIQ
ncbi:TRAP transporter large permease [Denitrobaculum tricleocarpae]|uniref:TRAP transporter large permease protein n=1 Tax=Denitrobaculum tricleocarpae TaxID=2591009 RepID=A0A545SZ80_9PROT|nr:TRAP transporter large permease [Denitrobaculum tricleocarpae]TQV70283.1 TRAP transporter large permease [Denitrobaculum tricleocarpae]